MRVEDDELPLTGFRMPRGPAWRFPWRRVLFGVVLVFAVLASLLFAPHVWDHPVAFFSGPPGSTTYVDPGRGFTLRFPDSWHGQRFSDLDTSGGGYRLEKRAVIISNIDHHFEFVRDNLWPPRYEINGLPSTLVAVQVSHSSGGIGISCLHDSPLPLSLDNAQPGRMAVRDASGMPIKNVYLRFSAGGDPQYGVTAWIGSQASSSDLATLDEIVASIWYEATGDPENGLENCLNGI